MSMDATEEKQNTDVKLRPASSKDLKELVAINKICFPDYYRWQSIYPIGTNWMRVVLQSDSSFTLVLEDDKGIFAYTTLVTDLALWKKEAGQRNGSIVSQIFAILCCPAPAAWKRLWEKAIIRLRYKKIRSNRTCEIFTGKTAWSEITAVLPRMQGKNYAYTLVQARDTLAAKTGIIRIQTHIDSDNIASRRLTEKHGFVLVFEDVRGCLYEKILIK